MSEALAFAAIFAAIVCVLLILCGWVLIEDARSDTDGPHAD